MFEGHLSQLQEVISPTTRVDTHYHEEDLQIPLGFRVAGEGTREIERQGDERG